MRATFEHSVAVLTKAYLTNTLQSDNCHSCAVGNLVANALRIDLVYAPVTLKLKWASGRPQWGYLVWQINGPAALYEDPKAQAEATTQIAASGYTAHELSRIEVAFEYAGHSRTSWQWPGETIIAGLLAVVGVLAQIHGVDPASEQAARERFNEACRTQTLPELTY
jgi:hypothetical protein